MKRYKFKTYKKIKKIHRQMISALGAEKIRYEYEYYYFSIKEDKSEAIEAHFKKIELPLFRV